MSSACDHDHDHSGLTGGALDRALAAAEAGADLIGTTLAGYTGERNKTEGPDLELIEQIAAANLGLPLIA